MGCKGKILMKGLQPHLISQNDAKAAKSTMWSNSFPRNFYFGITKKINQLFRRFKDVTLRTVPLLRGNSNGDDPRVFNYIF